MEPRTTDAQHLYTSNARTRYQPNHASREQGWTAKGALAVRRSCHTEHASTPCGAVLAGCAQDNACSRGGGGSCSPRGTSHGVKADDAHAYSRRRRGVRPEGHWTDSPMTETALLPTRQGHATTRCPQGPGLTLVRSGAPGRGDRAPRAPRALASCTRLPRSSKL